MFLDSVLIFSLMNCATGVKIVLPKNPFDVVRSSVGEIQLIYVCINLMPAVKYNRRCE